MAILDVIDYSYEVGLTARANTSISSGKWYWEIIIERGLYWDSSLVCVGVGTTNVKPSDVFAKTPYGWGIDSMGRAIHDNLTGSQVLPAFRAGTIQSNVTIGIALDMDNGYMWAIVADEWGHYDHVGDPTIGTNPHITNITGTVFPMVSVQTFDEDISKNIRIKGNFGKLPFKHCIPSGYDILIGPSSSSSSSRSSSSVSISSSSSASSSSVSSSSSSSISHSSSSSSSLSLSFSSSSSKSSSSFSTATGSGTYHTSGINDGYWIDTASGNPDKTGIYITLGTGTYPTDYHGFMGFEDIGIPERATIIDASLQMNVYFIDNTESVTVYGVEPSTPFPPGTVAAANSMLFSSVLVGSTISISSTGTAVADVRDEVQAIVNHESYHSDSSIIGFCLKSNNRHDNPALCHILSSEYGSPASLYVYWTTAY